MLQKIIDFSNAQFQLLIFLNISEINTKKNKLYKTK